MTTRIPVCKTEWMVTPSIDTGKGKADLLLYFGENRERKNLALEILCFKCLRDFYLFI